MEQSGVLVSNVMIRQAATAAADAEWRGVVEKLVEAGILATEHPILAGTITQQILLKAIAQAEKLIGRKL
jgi:hypothetical protein